MSTYSTTLRLELIGNGDQSGTWGDTTNLNLGDLLEAAITNVVDITFANATYTLTAYNGLPDEARAAVLNLIGTNSASQNLIAPAVEKTYIVVNNTGATVTIKTSGGVGVAIPNGATQIVWTNGTDFYQAATPSGLSTGTGNVVYSVSPTLTGVPVAPTAANGTNTTQIATTAFVTTAVNTATGSLGTMSTQNANNVTITGGTLSGMTSIAATTFTGNLTGNVTGTASNATAVTGATSNGYGTRTVSTSAPTGGSNGDIWYQY